ncbi:multidrug effflux MFS transporter [Roseivivax sediminis]|uniref:MFS transporter, DHA1 family, bicyclomycin/chloramphenicol resistance protein n=1 Tax=Roseivivax sediminis TaxID=936889 RepID=A0A1I1T3X7_9RHOB|nr:multidrug effflux MFS transporter [Roseivivax sediminis]SFD51828.1 MFS transporter, DHA1 family, bicyclomycin/chloramphenicol resistance protein [Roseivivax sediminis]
MALDPHPAIAGLASSIGGTGQMLTGGLMIALAGPFIGGDVLSMIAAFASCAGVAWLAAPLPLPRLRLRKA